MTTPKPSAKSATFSLNVSAKELFVGLWIVFAYYTVRSLGPLLQEALLPGSGHAVWRGKRGKRWCLWWRGCLGRKGRRCGLRPLGSNAALKVFEDSFGNATWPSRHGPRTDGSSEAPK